MPQSKFDIMPSNSSSDPVVMFESDNFDQSSEPVLDERNNDVSFQSERDLVEPAVPTLRRSERNRKPVERYGYI